MKIVNIKSLTTLLNHAHDKRINILIGSFTPQIFKMIVVR